MAGFNTTNTDYLVRGQVWSDQIKEILEDDLQAMGYVDVLTNFPDGDVLNIPSIGQMQVNDYSEDEAIVFNSMDTGNFQFQITDYKQAGTYITKKAAQDWFYMSQLSSKIVPEMQRALMRTVEAQILAKGPDGQTAANSNTINGAKHRFVAGGTNQVIALEDFAKASYALKKANVPMTNLVAIVDPSVGHELSTLTNLTNVSNNPRWEGIIADGFTTGMRFTRNVYGFDVYESNYLKDIADETIDSVQVTNGKANLFFSADRSILPFIGAWRQAPMVESDYNMRRQREEHVLTARYGFALYRPENMVCVLSDATRVY